MNPDSPKLHKSYEESAQSTLLILVPKNRNNDFVYSILVVNFFMILSRHLTSIPI